MLVYFRWSLWGGRLQAAERSSSPAEYILFACVEVDDYIILSGRYSK